MKAEGTWELVDDASAEDLVVLRDVVHVAGRALAVGGNATPLACFLRNGAAIVAGGSGRTEFRRLFIEYVWIEERQRGRGLGTAIIERLERAAFERGCTDAVIETLIEPVARLYARLGYTHIGNIPNYVGSFTRHTLRKTFPVK